MMCRDVSCDDAASANDATVTNGDARENGCAASYVGVSGQLRGRKKILQRRSHVRPVVEAREGKGLWESIKRKTQDSREGK